MKKIWTKPALVILVRGQVDESVLCHCKETGCIDPCYTPSRGVGGCSKFSQNGVCKDQCAS